MKTAKTDSKVQQDVIAELKWEPSVDATQVGVEVKDGVVTLTGQVGSYAEKRDAERAAQRVAGVQALAVEIQVKLPGASKRSDADIAHSVKNVLLWTTYLPNDSVQVVVEDGFITLSGTVDWEYQRKSASDVVRNLMGVAGVSNQIAVKPRVSMTAIKADIETALKRRALHDAHDIKVEVHGSDVTLTGTIHSWSERELAKHSAWSTPGVLNVVDNMKFAI
jgi:osmotically-inducible protein OsmY